jgi:hypothetical protein
VSDGAIDTCGIDTRGVAVCGVAAGAGDEFGLAFTGVELTFTGVGLTFAEVGLTFTEVLYILIISCLYLSIFSGLIFIFNPPIITNALPFYVRFQKKRTARTNQYGL